MKSASAWILILLSLLAAACSSAAAASGDAEAGKRLFHQEAIGPAPGCITCHSTEPEKVVVGPSLAGVGTRAGTRIPGTAAPDYLRESILNPNGFVVDGYPEGVMYQHFQEVLADDQVRDLTAYLLSLK